MIDNSGNNSQSKSKIINNDSFQNNLEVNQNKINEMLNKLLSGKESLNKEVNIQTLDHAFELIKEAIFYNLEGVIFYQGIIEEIVDGLLSQVIITSAEMNGEILENILSMLENLMYLFLFHYDSFLVYNGMKILNFLLNELDFDFHRESLQKMIKILFILKLKKSVSNLVCSKIITNFSLALLVVIHNSNDATRKCFFDFVLANVEDHIFMWILCNAVTSGLDFSKYYTIENIQQIITKSQKELDKHVNLLENNLQNLKTEKSISVKNKVKQSNEIIGCIAKVIEAFVNRENKTYNYDKLVKNSLIPSIKKYWNLILFVNDPFFYEIDFSLESVFTMINLTDDLNSLQFDILLPLLNWTGTLLEKNSKYIAIIKTVVSLINKTEIDSETKQQIHSVVNQYLQKTLSENSNDPIINYYVYSTLKLCSKKEDNPDQPELNLEEENNLCRQLLNSIDEINKESSKDELVLNLNEELIIKEYKEITLDPLAYDSNTFRRPTFNNINKNTQKLFYNSLVKYEEFKNSLKQLYSLESRNLMIDNKIVNFMEKEGESAKNKLDVCEKFFLESSIEMFKEIFSDNKNN